MKRSGALPLRRSSRIQLRVPVKLSGTLPEGRHFAQDTHVLSISKYGARLITHLPLKVGMQVRVQPRRGRDSALFRVAWMGREGTPSEGEVGIEYVRVSNLLGVTFPE